MNCPIIIFFLVISNLLFAQDLAINGVNEEINAKQLNDSYKLNIKDSTFIRLTEQIEKEVYPNIHSVLISKNGVLIYENYFSGHDTNFGEELGIVEHSKSTLHDTRSISKSVISALMGIAIDKGLIESVDQNIASFFPDYSLDGDKSNWTLEHFLTMTTGLDWNEFEVSYESLKNDETQMILSDNPIPYVLSKSLKNKPGKEFNYCSGATQVLAHIIERVSKMSIDEFARVNLFEPLEITNYEWVKMSKDGGSDNYSASAGLRLNSRDLLKIGLLYRNEGIWNGRKVLEKNWIRDSFTPYVTFQVNNQEVRYGYQFWMWSISIEGKRVDLINAMGNGDQRIYLDMVNDLIVVVTAGNYNHYDPSNNSEAMLKECIYPEILKK